MWIVITGRGFADRDDVSLYGLFPTRESAEAFIEDAHDPEDHDNPDLCIESHMSKSEVEYAEVMYMNEVKA